MPKVQAALLCDFAQVREGLLFVCGGGIRRIVLPEVPAPLGVMLTLHVEVPPEERANVHELTIVLVAPNLDIVHRAVAGFQALPGRIAAGKPELDDVLAVHDGESISAPFVLDLRAATVPEFGQYGLTITIDSQEAAHLAFSVVTVDPSMLR